jgi:hypothetical protein
VHFMIGLPGETPEEVNRTLGVRTSNLRFQPAVVTPR